MKSSFLSAHNSRIEIRVKNVVNKDPFECRYLIYIKKPLKDKILAAVYNIELIFI